MFSKNKILSIRAREILDSRGNPTLEVAVETPQGVFRAGVPSGASTGKYEVKELRDGGKRYSGRGVLKAVRNVNEVIAPKLKGKDAAKQKEIDETMISLDGTENKSRLGANAIVGVSMAVCRAASNAAAAGTAASKKFPWQHINNLWKLNFHKSGPEDLYKRMPTPCFNVINGGSHAGNELDIQEFMVVPQEKKFTENLRVGAEIYHELKKVLRKSYGPAATNVGDEGGFAPPIRTAQEALEAILQAAKNLGYGKKFKIILDVAASQFYERGKYKMKSGVFTREGLSHFYSELLERYPMIIGLEDPFGEEDWTAWRQINAKFPPPLKLPPSPRFWRTSRRAVKIQNSKPLIIGDDLLATNPKRIKEAYEKNACNAMILKVNQIGTVTGALEAARLAKEYGWKIIVSHRSGETCDDFIADLAVGMGADFIKTGAPARGERTAKYNRLLQLDAP